MRSERPYLSTTKRDAWKTFYLPKPLRIFGYGSSLLLIVLGSALADPPLAPASSPPSLIDTSPGAISQPADNSSTDNSQNQNNSQNSDNSQLPANTQTPGVMPTPTTPLLPQQGINAYLPFSSNYESSNNQPPQITAPNLYTTGVYSVSQIATTTSLAQAFTEQGTSDFYSEPGMSYSHPPIERIRLGPIDLKAALSSNVVYDDNLQGGGSNSNGSNNGNNSHKISDASYSVTPAILLVYGAHEGQRGSATLVYSPTISRYFHNPGFNTDNQNVAFNAQYPFQRLTLNASQTYSQSTGINVDTNSRTTQTAIASTAGGNYAIDDKLSFSSGFQYVKTSFSNPQNQNGGGNAGTGDQTTSVNSSLSYHLSDKLSVGPSVNFGVDKPDNSKQQTFEQGLVGVTYQPTAKINLYAQAGLEFRQGGGSDGNASTGMTEVQGRDTTDPIFSAGVGYNPFDSTSLSLSAYQSVYTSTDVTTDTVTTTGVSFTATQRFIQRVFLNLSFSYGHNESNGSGNNTVGGTGSGIGNGGSQDTFSFRPSISYSPTLWSSVALYYQYLDNESNDSASSYHDNQVGLSATVQF
jgi:hypothetical protein